MGKHLCPDLYSDIGTKRFNKHRSEKARKPSYITKAQKAGSVLRIIRFQGRTLEKSAFAKKIKIFGKRLWYGWGWNSHAYPKENYIKRFDSFENFLKMTRKDLLDQTVMKPRKGTLLSGILTGEEFLTGL